MAGIASAVIDLSFAPDGKTLAAGDYAKCPVFVEGIVKFFDPKTGALNRRIKTGKSRPTHLAYAPDGLSLLVRHDNGEMSLWDVRSGKNVPPPELSKALAWNTTVAFSPDGKWIGATTNKGGTSPTGRSSIVLWDLDAQRVRHQWEWEEKRVVLPSLAFSPDSKRLAVGTTRAEVKVFDLPG